MTLHSSLPTSGGVSESRPVETSAEALVASFAEADRHPVDLSGYGIEDWICLAFFWSMAGLVFLQFFTRYVLNGGVVWSLDEIASGQRVAGGTATGFTSWSAAGTTISTQVASDDATRRLMVILADQMATQILAASVDMTP